PPGVISGDQVGVRQPYGQELLLTEPRDDFAIACKAWVAYFDRHEALPTEVAHLVDDGHAPAAEFRQDLITWQCRPALHHGPHRWLVGRRGFRRAAGRGE